MCAKVIALFVAALVLVSGPSFAALSVSSLAAGTTDSALVAGSSAVSVQKRMFCGFSALETGGSATATVRIYNGTDATGELLFSFSLLPAESRSEGPWQPAQCLLAANGIFIDRGGSGTTLLSIFHQVTYP
jgi:hypothetical protein